MRRVLTQATKKRHHTFGRTQVSVVRTLYSSQFAMEGVLNFDQIPNMSSRHRPKLFPKKYVRAQPGIQLASHAANKAAIYTNMPAWKNIGYFWYDGATHVGFTVKVELWVRGGTKNLALGVHAFLRLCRKHTSTPICSHCTCSVARPFFFGFSLIHYYSLSRY